MSVREDQFVSTPSERPFAALEARLAHLIYVDAYTLTYVAIFILAVVTRFWHLGDRTMSHDESLHTRYSWLLFKGMGFQHTPLMHGPLLFHMTALNYLLFGDSDFTARIYAAIVGIIVVILPFFMRRWLGKVGMIAASLMLLISPMIMYYSRYIREDMPAILGALLMVLGIWHYMEKRDFRYLLLLTLGFAILYAQKEVSFIYVAIFGSFMTLYLLTRLLDVEWKNRSLYLTFIASLIASILLVTAFGALTVVDSAGAAGAPSGETTAEVANPTAEGSPEFPVAPPSPIHTARNVLLGIGAITILIAAGSVVIGQWKNLRSFPELDVAIVLGTLILPMLTPFLIHAAKFDPLDETSAGITRDLLFTLPIVFLSVLVGVIWGIVPPTRRGAVTSPDAESDERPDESPDLLDWVQAVFASRWWAIGGLFWLFFLFFFTTMFTNGAGIGTGVIGSLGYWLAQQEVKRGNQPWYYYILMLVPIYEFLPALLTLVAGAFGLTTIIRRIFEPRQLAEDEVEVDPDTGQVMRIIPRARKYIDLDAPIHFPVFLFTGYWAILNFVAYSVAGEKMPWLTTHLTVPMIILGAWVVSTLITSINWQKLWQSRAWLVIILLPILGVALLRTAGPICTRISLPEPNIQPGTRPPGETIGWGTAILGALRLPCTTLVPETYEHPIFAGPTIDQLSATSGWLAAVVVLIAVVVALFAFGSGVSFGQVAKLSALWIIAYLAFFTARTALIASFVNYNYATEYLVYAHSSGAVKDVMAQIDEISQKTTDGYGLKVAYDNKVSWPYTWYLRNYYNAAYYADQPSRGTIGDSPVILAGPDNWAKVESIIGDRYYKFEYIRMWWPMQDYFDLTGAEFKTFFVDPDLQRGVWEIFTRRNYDKYADAITKYRGSRPSFELSEWPVSERMRVYIRKDVFAQVWDYGVAASEIASATDPYAQGVRQMTPSVIWGSGILSRPHGSVIGPDGNLYVADSTNHRIAVFNPSGELVKTLGKFGLAPQEDAFNEPWDVGVAPDGSVYVADTWNHRIVQYDPEGNYVRKWGFEGPNQNDPAAFWGPRGIAVDDQGNVYLADTGNKRILVFEPNGKFVRQIGSGGAQDGQVDEPVGLAFGPDKLLYVADTWNQRIEVFTQDGNFVRQWQVDAWFAQTNERPYITVDAQGLVYITDPDAARVIVFDSTGQYRYSFGDATTIGLAGSISVDSEGHLYLVDTSNGTVQVYDVSNQSSIP